MLRPTPDLIQELRDTAALPVVVNADLLLEAADKLQQLEKLLWGSNLPSSGRL